MRSGSGFFLPPVLFREEGGRIIKSGKQKNIRVSELAIVPTKNRISIEPLGRERETETRHREFCRIVILIRVWEQEYSKGFME
jgi:hypothetical protein